MANSFSNLVNNLSEGIHRFRCKYRRDDKKCEACRIKYKYYDCSLEYISFKDDLIECKSLCCNKIYQHNFDEKLKERFFNTYKISNRKNNIRIISLFVCPKRHVSVSWCI